MMEKLVALCDKLLTKVLIIVIDRWDPVEWVEKNGRMFLDKLLAKLDEADWDDIFSNIIADPLKAWIKRKTGIDL